MKTHRLARIAEAIRETASETILFEVRDPRVKGVTVTRAEVSGDLQHAKIYVSIMGTPREQQLCLHGLKHSSGFIQSKLAARLQTRFTPVVEFVLDEGVKKSIEVTRLINEALGHPAAPAQEQAEGAEDESPPRAETADGTAEEERGES
jgi:ribosome-binding factor A